MDKQAQWETFDQLVMAKFGRARGATTLLFADGTAFGTGFLSNGSIVVGHLVIIKCVATGRIWDTGPGNGGASYDPVARCWTPITGSRWAHVRWESVEPVELKT